MNKETVEEIYPVEEVAKEVLQNNNLPVQGDFAEGFIAGSILGTEWQKEQFGKQWTDEEIKKKAVKNSSSYRAKAAAIISYTEGYKQALKDLGHE